MDRTIESRLIRIFEDLFDLKIDDFAFPDNLVYKEISKWDSFGHVELITKIESNFEVKLTFDDIVKMKSFKNCVDIISAKIL
jgi:acyl carrier protein